MFKNTYREAYLSKFAFLYIATGYFMGVFAVIDSDLKILIAVGVLFFASGFIILANLIVFLILKYSKEINRKITNEELEELGIEPDIQDESSAEIEKMFNE